MNFWMKNRIVEREKRMIFSKLKPQWFLHKYIYDNNKNINMFIKESLKNKNFSNFQATCQEELYLLFEKSGNFFHRVNIEIG